MNAIADQVQFDVLANGGGTGDLAQKLLASNFKVEALRPQTLLRKDEWVQYDTAVIEVAQQRLNGVNDLFSAGLTFALPNALGKTSIEWEKVSDLTGAQVSMAGVTEGQNDRVDFDLDRMPVPIVHKDFTLNIRALSASRTTGEALDTTQASLATRKVTEAVESMLFNGSTILGSGNPIYGYLTAPNRNTGSVSASWLTAPGTKILSDVLAMINMANADNYYGPFILYVPQAVYTHMSEDFKAESDRTILERIEAVPNIQSVRPAEMLTASNVILVQLTRDVVDIVDGIQPTTVQWESAGGFTQHFKVMAIMPPRIRDTYTNQSGIVHYS